MTTQETGDAEDAHERILLFSSAKMPKIRFSEFQKAKVLDADDALDSMRTIWDADAHDATVCVELK